MTRAMFVAVAVALGVVGSAATHAQAPPDFSGTWQLERSEPAGFQGATPEVRYSTGRGWGAHAPTLVIKQTANNLVLESTHWGEVGRDGLKGPRQIIYQLDGSERITDDPKYPGDRRFRWKTKARLEGSSLLLFTYQDWNSMVDTLSLNGGQLTILREVSGQSGGATVDVPHTLVYRRVSR